MSPTTVDRVPLHTAHQINERIKQETDERVRRFARQPEGIPTRLKELDEEWDVERVLETNASTLAFIGVALGGLVDKRWLILPALVTGFLFQHATQGWCPPLPVLRRLGYRTSREIDIERNALKALRGDFADSLPAASPDIRAANAMQAARG